MDSLVKIDLLGQSYTLRTDAKRVKAAAEVLRAKLNEYEGATRSNIKLDVALLAGLDLASELLQFRDEQTADPQLELRLQQLMDTVDQHLEA